ncbi:MAG TPA: ABC transporter permease [Puia sp.]|jgi:putative ABC transport system permease protein|nr:ABC transporter permease [Puia sp.]
MMLINYFKIAFRNLQRNKASSFINIFGLAVGLATSTLIMLYILSELGYDHQNKDSDRIFRIATKAGQLGNVKDKPWARTSAPIAWGLKQDMPEVEQATRLLKFPTLDKMLLRYEHNRDGKQFYETNGYYVDSTFFQIFTYDFKYGSAVASLNEPNSVVISEEVAQKMFGNENPVGKSIKIGMPYGNFNYTVKGVYKDVSIKSHIPAHFFLSMRNGDIGTWTENQTNWATNNLFFTYVKLKKGTDPKTFEKKLQPFLQHRGGTDLKALGVSKQLFIQNVKDIYLHSDLDSEIAPNGNITYLYILGSIALFVLLIACVNFMNLSTARSGKRAKEVGIRKVLGAEKRSLIYQFLGESLTMSFLALLLALLLASALLPFFDTITQKNLHLFDKPELWFGIAGLTLCAGVLSGIYPAFYLSSFRPIAVLKGKLLNNLSAVTIRKALVVFQFTISICLVLAAVVIIKQLNFLDNKQLGFNKNEQIVLPLQDKNAIKNYASLKNELLKNTNIKSVTSGSTYPGIPNVEDLLFYPEGKTTQDVIDVHLCTVEDDYFKTLGFTILAGRGFSKEFTADSNSIVLNEAALKEFGYDVTNAVGRKLYFDFQGTHNTMNIVGVVKNFNFESLYTTIKPFGFTTSVGNKYGYAIVNVSTRNYTTLLKDLSNAWSKINPEIPFVYSFLDNDFRNNYEKDQRVSVIVSYFTCIAILIACLGLFGLSVFSAEQRTREIGIRKVLGASVTNITSLLSKDFIKLVLIALVIASPVAWYGMNKWLEIFAYRTPVSWWMFVLAGLLAILIALLTVSFHAIKAAIANPVKSLRTE